MKIKSFLFALSMIGLLFACNNDDGPDALIDLRIDLADLQEGQSSSYQRITGHCGLLGELTYSGDVLTLTVEKTRAGLFLTERFTEDSPLFQINPDPVSYPVEKEEGRIVLRDRSASALFFFYGSDYLNIHPQHEVNLTQNECQQLIDGFPFTGDQIAKLDQFELMDFAYTDQTVVSCIPVFINAEAFLIYKGGQLNMSYALTSGFPGITFNGWKLME